MSFQAYLDNAEAKSGKTPAEFVELAKAKGFGAETKTGEIVSWLKADFELGHGHAMALAHVIQHGPRISDKFVGSGGTHNDESNMLKLDGIKNRQKT